MKDETIIKIVGFCCGTAIVIFALASGHDGTLAAAALASLWGGEQIYNRVKRKVKNERGE